MQIDTFEKLVPHLTSAASTLIQHSRTVRNLFMKKAHEAAYEYLIKKNPERRPIAVQMEKLQIAVSTMQTAFKRMEDGLYSNNIIRRACKLVLEELVLESKGKSKEAKETFRARYGRTPPGFLVIAPTLKCNLRCEGCYAKSYDGSSGTIPFSILDRILTEKADLWGSRYVTWVGGEPTVYRSEGKDILDVSEKHLDHLFFMYTNGVLIDKEMAGRMADLGNVVPQVSVEGFEKETDQRRGKGVFTKILKAFEYMREAGVPFGIAITPMRHNAEFLTSEEFIEFYFNKEKANLAWVFHYMPVGRDYSLDLMITPEQRLKLLNRERELLWEKGVFYVDFWNSGPLADGCIAAGREGGGYLYIDGNGWVTPCPYFQFSPINIFDVYKNGGNLNTVYDQPFFEALRKWQDQYAYAQAGDEMGNLLRPCPMRDHHKTAMDIIRQYQPRPLDEDTEKWLQDETLHQGLIEFDEKLAELMDPYWKEVYLNHKGGESKSVSASSRKGLRSAGISSHPLND